jgi:3-carboxy-cis,cis-muconate cycloisomerase
VDRPAAAGGGAGLFGSILTTDAMAACTSDAAWLQAMLDVEAALASVEAANGVIPPAAAETIAACCDAGLFDADAIGRSGRLSANPVIPLLAALREAAGSAGAYAHVGATSQDILDTASMIVIRAAATLVLEDLRRMAAAAAELTEHHRDTVTVARTLLQQAVPTTFAMKAAGWLNATLDAIDLLERTARERLAVQLGGAGGTLAALGDNGPPVIEGLAHLLGLTAPAAPWHADRTRLAEVGTAFAVAAGVAGKIALDVSLLMQREVAEAFEPSAGGRGTSSTMPQKRNPALSATAVASARRAAASLPVLLGSMIQEHERGVGAMQSEWLTLTELLRASGGSVAAIAEVLEGLEVDGTRMAEVLASSRGLVLAEHVSGELGKRLGRESARALVEEACQAVLCSPDETTLAREVTNRLPRQSGVSAAEVESWLDPLGYLGSVDWFVERVLGRYADLEAIPARRSEHRRGAQT